MTEFNPADYTIADVNTHLEKHPEDLKAVLAAEQARGDDARVTLVESLEEQAKSIPDQVGSPAVEVRPAEPTAEGTTSSDRRHTVHGKDYTVTPDRGYRRS